MWIGLVNAALLVVQGVALRPQPPMPRVPLIPGLSQFTTFVAALEFRTVTRWLGLALAVGIASGLAAALFHALVGWVGHWTLGVVGNLCLPGPDGDRPVVPCAVSGPARSWAVVLLPALGGLVGGWLVSLAGDPDGAQGTEAVVDAFHNGYQSRRRVHLLKAFSAVVVLATGGSAGREGPIALAGAALASIAGRFMKLSAREGRLLMLAGAAGGVGAIFGTPLGAALFAVEVLYRDDFEVDALVPTVLASVVGYSVYTLIYGSGSLFGVSDSYGFYPAALPLYLLMAAGSAVVGVLFLKILNGPGRRFFAALKIPPVWKPALGGLLLGLLALRLPQALGSGYGWLQTVLHYPSAQLPAGFLGAAVLLGLAFLKILTTTLTVGSGAPGGVFGPSVAIGGLVGGAFGVVFHLIFPSVVPHPEAFAIVGMAAFVGGVAHAPISTLVMASEMTGSYELLVPLMLCEVVMVTLMGRLTLFNKQVPTRKQSGAHSAEYALDVLQEVTVGAVVKDSDVLCIKANLPLSAVLKAIAGSEQSVFPMTDLDGRYDGLITVDTLRATTLESDVAQLAIAADCSVPFASVAKEASLAKALELLVSSHCQQLPVMVAERVCGLLSYEEVLAVYNQEAESRSCAQEERF